ncbi:hypothetical protein GCM10028807_16540 [Spirosoma daeguense]
MLEDELNIFDVLQRTATTSFPEAEFIPVTSFDDAQTYLFNLAGNGPRLVLVDISLGGSRTGLDFLKVLKEHPLGRLVPVVVLSSMTDKKHIIQAYTLGASSYFVKPFSLQEWKNLLSNLRQYWYDTCTLPQTYFERLEEIKKKP